MKLPQVNLCPRAAMMRSMRKSIEQAKHVPERAEFFLGCAKRAFWALVEMSR